ncbi:hypothetical protein NE865_08443 [Phthorimaea operculella]|nr:hypothetical protein NE865_08443 [Phthorimaea operculella]
MKQIVLFLSTLAVAFGWDAGFRVRFGLGGYGKDHFVSLPMTLAEAKKQSWTQEERVDIVLPSLVMYCHETFMICVMYDDTEYAAGLQVAVPANDFQQAQWDWDTQGWLKWIPSNSKSYWAKHQYFVTEEYLETSAEERVANRDKSSLLSVGGSVWVSGIRAERFEITKRPDLSKGFTEQACVPGMGHHYWRLNETTECNSEMFPWFSVHDNHRDLVAMGLYVPGKLDPKDLPKDWFERAPAWTAKILVPHGPQCLYDLGANPGLLSIHTYYVSDPWKIVCLF